MRVLVLIPGPLGDRLSAPEVRGWNIALELARRHEVEVAAPGAGHGVQDGIAIRAAARREVLEAARSADAVVAPWVPPYLYAGLPVSRTLFVADMYNPADVEHGGGRGLASRLRLSSMRANDRLQLRFADVVLCAVEAQRRRLQRQIEAIHRDGDGPLLRVVPFGIDNEEPEVAGHRPIRERFPEIGEDDTIVLWWGNVWRWFDAETALRAFASVADSRPRVRLVFTGGRSPRGVAADLDHTERAKELARTMGLLGRSVFFLDDWIPHAIRHEYLQEADLGFTLHRDTPEKDVAARGRYMDYLWTRLPCLLGAGDELADRFGDVGFATTVPPGDLDATIAALSGLVDDSAARDRARAAAESLVQAFRWSAAVHPLHDALDELTASRPLRARSRLKLASRLAGVYARRAAERSAAILRLK